MGVGQQLQRLPRIIGDEVDPRPVTLARSALALSSAFWPALTELIASFGELPPKA